jgi:3-mercaptopyruvate sulfurtransferase SseA
MRFHTLALAILLAVPSLEGRTLVLPVSTPVASAQAMRNVPRISIDDVKPLIEKKQVLLIDVRDPQSFAAGHMPDAINVPFDRIPAHVEAWKTEKRLIVTYCA